MYIIGHRGAAGLAPENSILAFQTAIKNKVDAIECDIRVTKDNRLVIMHDDTFLRIAGDKRKVKNLKLEQIKKITTNEGQKIPTLEEALKTAGKTTMIIEGKSTDWAIPLAKILTKFSGPKPKVISYDHKELYKFKELMPKIETYAVADNHSVELMLMAKNQGFTGISLFAPLYNPIIYYFCRRYKLKLISSPIDPRWRIILFHFLYPKVMITTNFPDKVINHHKRLFNRKKRRLSKKHAR